jgi:hypothetical protein
MKSLSICFFLALLLTVAKSASIASKQSQINDPAKGRVLSDCTNKSYSFDNILCCDLKVNDMLNLTKRVCVDLSKKNNLEPMATISSFNKGRCHYGDYKNGDRIERIWCKGPGNMDKVKMWPLSKFVRVLNPRDKERSLEACQFENWGKCW